MRIFLCLLFLLISFSQSFGGDDIEQRIKAIEDTLKSHKKAISEQEQFLNELKEQKDASKDIKTGTDGKTKATTAATGILGNPASSNPNISLLLNTFVYTSNLKESDITGKYFPAHVGELGLKNGFNLESAELFLFAPVDPYFNLYASIPITFLGIEIEEAYFVTTTLPAGFQIKGGKFRSNFGRINSQHAHQWDFADSPLPYPAFLGGDGIREVGMQLTYLPDIPIYTLMGVEVLQGANDVLFNSDSNSRSGPNGFTTFMKTSFDTTDNSTLLLGPSLIKGKTNTKSIAQGTEFRGESTLYGFELTHKWKHSKGRGLITQSEYFQHVQKGELKGAAGAVDSLTRVRDGFYVQSVYQLDRWRFGARYSATNLFKNESILAGARTDTDEMPWKATGSIEFSPTEFSLIRFQYNNSKLVYSQDTNHEFILQVTMGIGAHAAHSF